MYIGQQNLSIWRRLLGGVPKPGILFGPPTTNTGLSLKDSKGIEATFVQSNCLTFDGTDDRVDLKNKITWFDTTTNSWTVEGWFYFTTSLRTDMLISNFLTKGFYITKNSGGKISVLYRNTATTDDLLMNGNTVLASGIWYKVRVTYNGSKLASGIKIYINDVEDTYAVTTDTLTANSVSTTSLTTTLGASQSSATPTYANNAACRMCGIKIWSTVQTPGSTVEPDLLSMMVAGGNGNLIGDGTANGNIGTMQNFNLATCWTNKQDVYHGNITKGFNGAVKGNKTDGYIRINNYKNRGTGNFWYRTKVLCNSVYATSNEGFSGCMSASSSEDRYGIILTSANKISSFFDLGALTATISMLNTLVVGTYYDLIININRAGNIEFFVNGVSQGTVNISSASGTPFVATNDFYLFTYSASGGGPAPTTYCNQTILGASSGTGLIDPLNPDATTPDVYNFIPSPNKAGFVETVTNTEYLATAGTLANVKVGASLPNPTKDIFGNTLQYPAGARHNGAETQLDFTKGQLYGTETNLKGIWSKNSFNNYTNKNQLYGEYYFSWFFDSQDVQPVFRMLFRFSPTIDGYLIAKGANGELIFRKYVNNVITTLFTTANNYVAINTKYDFKIVRNETVNQYVTGAKGTRAVYIKGGAYGDTYTLVTVTSGSNPVTDDTWNTGTFPLSYGSSHTTLGKNMITEYDSTGYNCFSDLALTTPLKSNYLLNRYNGEIDSSYANKSIAKIAGSYAYASSIQTYGTWYFTINHLAADRIYVAFMANLTNAFTNSWTIIFDSLGINLSKNNAGVTTNTTALSRTRPLNTEIRCRIERNQTLNQYFTGAADAFRVSFQGHSVNYPVGGANREVGVILTDSFTPTTNYFMLRSFSFNNSGYVCDVWRNGVEIRASEFANVTANGWIPNLTNFTFNDPYYNSFFYRKVYKYVVNIIRNDRFLIYNTLQVAPALTKILNYIKDLFIANPT